MTIGKLCLAMFGQNITKEEVEQFYNKLLEQKIQEFHRILPEYVNKKYIHLYESNELDTGRQLVSNYQLADDLKKYFKKNGYYVNNSPGGSAVNMFFYDKTLIDSLMDEFDNILKKHNIEKKYESKDEIKYHFDKFCSIKDLNDNTVRFMKEMLSLHY